MKKIIIALTMLLSFLSLFSQDTIKVVQYNLLYYGLDNDYCNSSNNDIGDKTNYLKTIVAYLKPDIFAVNEIDDRENVNDYLLGNVFLLNGFPNYERAEILSQYLTDQIFYNSKKLTLKSQDVINSDVRDYNVYKFYYNSPDLQNGDDTVFLYYILAHLKAGSSESDSTDRIIEANDIMDYISLHIPQNSNIILSGDFNFYSSYEGAYQLFTNYTDSTNKFIDPGTEGYWHDNENFSYLHTQSTHYTGNGCASSGGLDDRFDFILYSTAINENTNKINFITNSFETIGQDGQHLNQSVDYGTNNSVPYNVLTALANNSDHLPVTCSFLIHQTPVKIKTEITQRDAITVKYINNTLNISILDNRLLGKNINTKIYTIDGKEILNTNIKTNTKQLDYTTNIQLQKNNIYIIKFTTNKASIIKRIIP